MLQIKGVSKRFGSQQVLQQLSLHILAGQVYGLLGPNGAGKTTTINILCNLIKPDRGVVLFNQQPLSDANKHLIGVVPQENLLYKCLTCREHLQFFGKIYGLTPRQLLPRVEACLALVGLSDRATSLAETLSGGMQRRLSMAIALVHQPKLVILDEPTAGLDIEARYEIWQVIRGLQQEGVTILLTTHLFDEVERLCQHIGILQSGRLIASGTLSDLRQGIHAQEIVTIQTKDEQAAIDRGNSLGFMSRRYGADLTFWLPQVWELEEILHHFAGIPIDAIARQPVGLEHIYLELTTNAAD